MPGSDVGPGSDRERNLPARGGDFYGKTITNKDTNADASEFRADTSDGAE